MTSMTLCHDLKVLDSMEKKLVDDMKDFGS